MFRCSQFDILLLRLGNMYVYNHQLSILGNIQSDKGRHHHVHQNQYKSLSTSSEILHPHALVNTHKAMWITSTDLTIESQLGERVFLVRPHDKHFPVKMMTIQASGPCVYP